MLHLFHKTNVKYKMSDISKNCNFQDSHHPISPVLVAWCTCHDHLLWTV